MKTTNAKEDFLLLQKNIIDQAYDLYLKYWIKPILLNVLQCNADINSIYVKFMYTSGSGINMNFVVSSEMNAYLISMFDLNKNSLFSTNADVQSIVDKSYMYFYLPAKFKVFKEEMTSVKLYNDPNKILHSLLILVKDFGNEMIYYAHRQEDNSIKIKNYTKISGVFS